MPVTVTVIAAFVIEKSASVTAKPAGGSIRDESSDVAGVLADRGRTIEELTEDNAAKRAEIYDDIMQMPEGFDMSKWAGK